MASAAVLIQPPPVRESSPSSSSTTSKNVATKLLPASGDYPATIYSSYKPAPGHNGSIRERDRESSGAKYPTKLGVNGAPQEVHVVKVTAGDSSVQIEPASSYGKSSPALLDGPSQAVHEHDRAFGPPPPSPPASVEENVNADSQQQQEGEEYLSDPSLSSSSSRMLHLVQSDPTAARNASLDSCYSQKSAPTSTPRILNGPIRISSPQPLQQPLGLQRSSTDTNAAYAPPTPRTIITQPSPPPPTTPRFENGNAEASTSMKAAAAHLSIDGYLQPPPLLSQKPARRNTTGSDRKSTRLNSSHSGESRMPSSA